MNILENLIVLDIETTGSHPINNEIIEIGAVKIKAGKVIDKFNALICPNEEIPPFITAMTGINNKMVSTMPNIEEVLPRFIDFCSDTNIVSGHNINLFDYRMIKAKAVSQGLEFEKNTIDTLVISRKCLPHLPSRKLGDLCEYYGIDLENAHRAYDDAYATYQLLVNLSNDYEEEFSELFKPVKLSWEPNKQSPITPKQKSFLLHLMSMHGVEFKGDINKLTKSGASKKIDGIIRQYGRYS